VKMSSRTAVGVLGGLLLSLAAPFVGASSALAGFTVPYTDPNSSGTIGLCDKNGHTITSGKISDNPFAWTAVSSAPAAQGYRGVEHKAILIAFLPMQGLDPGYWSGKNLTASSSYTNLAHPMAQATIADGPLKWFVAAFPPRWDGLIQLRLYLSAYNTGTYTTTYPTTDIRVTGNTWTVVRGGTGSCSVGKAVSIETQKLTQEQIDRIAGVTPSPTTAAAGAGASSSSSPGAAKSAAGQSSNAAQANNPNSASSVSNSSGGSNAAALALLLGAAVLGLAVGAFVWWRSRRGSAIPPGA
jgi:hypothetical protein